MQTPPSLPTGLEQTVIELARNFGSGIVGAIIAWLTFRKKLKPEIQQIDAITAKTYAEARQIDGETLGDAYKRIEELYVICDGQRTQISRLQLALDKAIRNEEFLEAEMQWLYNVIKAASVDLKAYGHMRKTVAPKPPDQADLDKPKS